MKKALLAVAVALAAVAMVAPPSASAGQSKADVCHADGQGDLNLITIADPALQAHEDHGDPAIGSPVGEGFILGPDCIPVAIPDPDPTEFTADIDARSVCTNPALGEWEIVADYVVSGDVPSTTFSWTSFIPTPQEGTLTPDGPLLLGEIRTYVSNTFDILVDDQRLILPWIVLDANGVKVDQGAFAPLIDRPLSCTPGPSPDDPTEFTGQFVSPVRSVCTNQSLGEWHIRAEYTVTGDAPSDTFSWSSFIPVPLEGTLTPEGRMLLGQTRVYTSQTFNINQTQELLALPWFVLNSDLVMVDEGAIAQLVFRPSFC